MKAQILVAALLASAALPDKAVAQDVPPTPPAAPAMRGAVEQVGEAVGITDIIVYGQRRSAGESAQRVPIAITALDATLLAASNAVDVTDIGALAPNVQTTYSGTTPGFPNFSIRGIGINASIRSIDAAVNLLQDGMVIAYPAGSLQSTFDLESVEILRGPQGVLFGRNATGGAISLRTRRPQRDFQLLTDLSYGNFNTFDANASIEGALGTGAIMAKLAVLYRRTDGFVRNTNEGIFLPTPGNPTGSRIIHQTGLVGAQDQLTIKPTIVFEISDAHTLTVFGQYQRHNDDGSFVRNFVPSTGPTVPLQTVFGFFPTVDGYRTNISDAGYLRLRQGHVIGELVSEIGAAKLTTVAAWRRIRFDSTVDFNGGPIPLNILPDNREKNVQYSAETRLNIPFANDRVELTAGLFYLKYETDVVENRQVSRGAAAPFSYTFSRGTFDQTTQALAGFANIDWRFTDRLTVSAGGRYSSDRKDFTGAPLTPCIGESLNNCPQTFTTRTRRWTNFSPRAVINFQATDRILGYASFTRGFRSGNFNSRVTSAAGFEPAGPETIDSYEVGVKADLLDRTLRVNIAGFLQKYDDIQQVSTLNIPGFVPVQTLINAASAELKGIEAEITAQPIRALRFEAILGYIDASFSSFRVPLPGVADPTGLQFPRIPEFTVTVAANLSTRLGSLPGKLEGRVSYDYRSATFSDLSNNPRLEIDGFGLLNANLTYVADNWSLGLFARNIGNVDYAEAQGLALSYAKWGGQPRTYGIRFTTRMD